jgi:hypothetical protein
MRVGVGECCDEVAGECAPRGVAGGGSRRRWVLRVPTGQASARWWSSSSGDDQAHPASGSLPSFDAYPVLRPRSSTTTCMALESPIRAGPIRRGKGCPGLGIDAQGRRHGDMPARGTRRMLPPALTPQGGKGAHQGARTTRKTLEDCKVYPESRRGDSNPRPHHYEGVQAVRERSGSPLRCCEVPAKRAASQTRHAGRVPRGTPVLDPVWTQRESAAADASAGMMRSARSGFARCSSAARHGDEVPGAV